MVNYLSMLTRKQNEFNRDVGIRVRKLLEAKVLTTYEKRKLLTLLIKKAGNQARNDYYTYIKMIGDTVLPTSFVDGRHIKLVCDILQATVVDVETKALHPTNPCISLPPGSSKSVLCSQGLPTWALGRNPSWFILAVGHSQDFMVDNSGRRAKDIMMSSKYKLLFPNTNIRDDVAAAGRFYTTENGMFVCAGWTTNIAGRRATLAILDDVVSEQTAQSDSEMRKIREWYGAGLESRLLSRAAVINLCCLTGDTRVLHGDGYSKPIKDFVPGDYVRSFNPDTKVFEDAMVLGMIPQGKGRIWELKTSNSTIRGTHNHPILVKRSEDVFEWVDLSKLRKGDVIVRVSDFETPEETYHKTPELTPDELWMLGLMYGDGWVNTTKRKNSKRLKDIGQRRYVTCLAKGIHEDIDNKYLNVFEEVFKCKPTLTNYGYYRCDRKHVALWFRVLGFEGNAKTKRLPTWVFALKNEEKKHFLQGLIDSDGYYIKTSGEHRGHFAFRLCNEELVKDIKTLVTGMGYKTSNISYNTRMVQPPNSPKPVKAETWGFECYNQTLDVDYTLTTVRSVIETEDEEEVYDLQVQGNMNFVADGLVVHNTRWRPDDLIGFVLESDKKRDKRNFLEVRFPAIVDKVASSILKIPEGESFWPELWPKEVFFRRKESISPAKWQSLYLQNPVPEEGSYIKWDWCTRWEHKDAPPFEFVLMSLDTATTGNKGSDPTGLSIWGIYRRTFDGFMLEKKGESLQMFLLKGEERRMDFIEMLDTIDRYLEMYDVDVILIEDTPGSKMFIQELQRRSYPVIAVKPTGRGAALVSKVDRLLVSQPSFIHGRIVFPKTRWADDCISKLCQFPHGANDDFVDSVSMAVNWIQKNYNLHTGNEWDEEDSEDDNYSRPRTYWSLA